MGIIKVVLATLISIVIIFFLTKIMGNKQISQVSMFDYIVGITIGSIAAEMSTDFEGALKPAVAMLIYAFVAIAISFLTNKSNRLRKFFIGKPIIVFEQGKLHKDRLNKARLDINEFMTLARIQGYYDLDQVQTAVFEQNGTLSFLPKAQNRAVTSEDLKIPVEKEEIPINIIVDGNIMKDELVIAGKDQKWLSSVLKENGYKSASEVFLGVLHWNGKTTFFKM